MNLYVYLLFIVSTQHTHIQFEMIFLTVGWSYLNWLRLFECEYSIEYKRQIQRYINNNNNNTTGHIKIHRQSILMAMDLKKIHPKMQKTKNESDEVQRRFMKVISALRSSHFFTHHQPRSHISVQILHYFCRRKGEFFLS